MFSGLIFLTETAVNSDQSVIPKSSKYVMSSTEKLILISISIGTLMTALDATIVNIADSDDFRRIWSQCKCFLMDTFGIHDYAGLFYAPMGKVGCVNQL